MGMTDEEELFYIGHRAFGALFRELRRADDDKLAEILRDRGVRDAVSNAKTLNPLQVFMNTVENFALLELCTYMSKEDAATVSRAIHKSCKKKPRMLDWIMEIGLSSFLESTESSVVKGVAAVLGLTPVEGCPDEWFDSSDARNAVADELMMVGTMKLLSSLDVSNLLAFSKLVHVPVNAKSPQKTIVDDILRSIFQLVCCTWHTIDCFLV